MDKAAFVQEKNQTDATPWLSVIVPIYNSEKYVRRCVDSILRQSFRDFELLLIDDGSTDRTSDICTRYAEADPRVRFYRKENGGCYQSRLYGLERMQGKFFTFCDSDDDYCSLQAFQIIHDKIVRYGCQVLEFRCQKVYRFRRLPIIHLVPCDTFIDQKCFREQQYPKFFDQDWPGSNLYLSVWCKVFDSSLARKLPSSASAPQLFGGEDRVINLYLLENVESVLLIPDVLYSYRQPPNRGTRTFSKKAMEDLDKVIEARLHFLARWEGPDQDREMLEEKVFETIAKQLYRFTLRGLRAFSREDLEASLHNAVVQPQFQLARQYYLEHTENKWWLLNLLRAADPKAYIERAEIENREHRLKKTLWRIRNRILSWL